MSAHRGQVGIGTLIVFIAMLLVAALLAGVVIDITEVVSQQADETGEQSTQKVLNNLEIEYVIGTTATATQTDQPEVQAIDIVVSRTDGAGPLDLRDLHVTYLPPTGAEQLTYVPNGTVTEGAYDIESIQADTTEPVITTDQDLYRLHLRLAATETNTHEDPADALQAGHTAEVVLTTGDGAQRTVPVIVPDPLGNETVEL